MTNFSGVLSIFYSFFSTANFSSLFSRFPPCLRSIFLAVYMLLSVGCIASCGDSFILIVLVFCYTSLLLENLAGVPLFVSYSGCSCYSVLIGVSALLMPPLTNLLVEPRKTLLMSPIAFSLYIGTDVRPLFVREALVDWYLEKAVWSISWNITFLSKTDGLFGSRLNLTSSSADSAGSVMSEELEMKRWCEFGLVRVIREIGVVVPVCCDLMGVFSCLLMIFI